MEIDGAIGGGQILRTAVSLAALTLTPLQITNIRKNRPQPGLRPQHLSGVKAAAEICKADVSGLQVGSTTVKFVPRQHDFSDKDIDIGTAGSLPLLLQTLTPTLIFSDKPITLKARGGTAGRGAPTAEYIKFVVFPMLSRLGIKQPNIEIVKQGFYPAGGGLIRVKFFPTKRVESMTLLEQGKIRDIKGFSIAGKLPLSVAQRQASAAKKFLSDNGFESEMNFSSFETFSAGTSMTIFADCENTILGADGIGKLGKRAEKVGEEVATSLLLSINSHKALDTHMADQIIPFLALAKGKSEVTVEEITNHVMANILVTQKILGVEFKVDEKERRISVEGMGFCKVGA
jgi:RNA 3'-terminal phosphate cyclase (ATP)